MGGNGEVGVVVEPEFEIRDSGIAAFGIGVINARFPPTIPNAAKLQPSTPMPFTEFAINLAFIGNHSRMSKCFKGRFFQIMWGLCTGFACCNVQIPIGGGASSPPDKARLKPSF